MKTFRNPIRDMDAPDPFMTYDPVTGYYYSLFTLGNRLELYRSRRAADILNDEDTKVVFRAGDEHGIYGAIWAPEMHKAPDGKWYIYSSGTHKPRGSGDDSKHLFCMRSHTEDPFDGFEFMGKMGGELTAIDPTVMTHDDGKQYICYSLSGGEQMLEIAELENPYTISNRRAVISRAIYPWELVPPYTGRAAINEGAFFLKNAGRLFIIYSGNGCWSNDYCFGVLEYKGGDICSADAWFKHPEPIFTRANGVFGPGHASFFKSPDGSEVWCAYHGMKKYNETAVYAPRYFNLQKVDFDETGYPVMGEPAGYETDIIPPSGETEL